jgi:hypothetical protein
VCKDHSKNREAIKAIDPDLAREFRVCDKCFGSGDTPPQDVEVLAAELKRKNRVSGIGSLTVGAGLASASTALGAASAKALLAVNNMTATTATEPEDNTEIEEREAMWVPNEAASVCFICTQVR